MVPIVREVRHGFNPFELYVNHIVDDRGDPDVEDGADVVLAVAEDLGDLPGVAVLGHADVVGTPLFVASPVEFSFRVSTDCNLFAILQLLRETESKVVLSLGESVLVLEVELEWTLLKVTVDQVGAPLVKLLEELDELFVVLVYFVFVRLATSWLHSFGVEPIC